MTWGRTCVRNGAMRHPPGTHPTTPADRARLVVYVPDTLAADVHDRAAAEGLSLSAYVRRMLLVTTATDRAAA